MSHGILTDTYLLCDVNGEVSQVAIDTSTLHTFGDYLNLALEWNVHQIWVLSGTDLSNRFADYDDTFVTTWKVRGYTYLTNELRPFMAVQKTVLGNTKTISLVLQDYIEDGIPDELMNIRDASTLYRYIYGVENLLGVPFTRDAKGTGITLLESFYKFKDLWNDKVNYTPFYTHKTVDRQWSRCLSSEEKTYTYLHTIDINTMYLANTKNVKVGKGVCKESATLPFNPSYPGLWYVQLLNQTELEAKGYPPIFKSPSFQSTELVQKALELGYKIQISGSYTFTDSWEMFIPWFAVLKNALEIDSKYKVFKPFIKKLCNPMIGLMGREKEEGDSIKWYNRPDIYNSVVSSSISSLYTTLEYMAQVSIPVVYVDVDTIGYLSNEHFECSLPDKVPLSSNIGDFRHTGTYPVKHLAKYCTSSIHTLKDRLKEVKLNG